MTSMCFSDVAYTQKKKTTRKARFLSGLYDVESMRRFAGISLDDIPDETTIGKFRHFLRTHGLTEVLFERTVQHRSERGLLMREGTIVDATIVAAPTSTKNRDRARDPEMGATKKGTSWHFGLKAHIGSDPHGRMHQVVVTSASVHDSQVMADCLHGDEQVLYGDKADADAQRQQEAEAQGIEWRVHRKATRHRKRTCADRSFNRKSNCVRARVEHIFGIIKHRWGYRKVRYRGLANNGPATARSDDSGHRPQLPPRLDRPRPDPRPASGLTAVVLRAYSSGSQFHTRRK